MPTNQKMQIFYTPSIDQVVSKKLSLAQLLIHSCYAAPGAPPVLKGLGFEPKSLWACVTSATYFADGSQVVVPSTPQCLLALIRSTASHAPWRAYVTTAIIHHRTRNLPGHAKAWRLCRKLQAVFRNGENKLSIAPVTLRQAHIYSEYEPFDSVLSLDQTTKTVFQPVGHLGQNACRPPNTVYA